MKRVTCALSLAAVMVAFAFATNSNGADEPASIKAIMGKLTKGPASASGKLKTAVKAEPAAWAEIKTAAEAFEKYGPDMPKNEAPKGDQADYVKLATAFATNSKDLATAAAKEDLAGVNAAFGKISSSCMTCHKAHKP